MVPKKSVCVTFLLPPGIKRLTLFSTNQLSQRHNLNNSQLFKVMLNGEAVERVNTKKILGIYFDENLSWSYHVNKVIQSS